MNSDMKVPILFKRKEDCVGCAACQAICQKSAISIQLDEEGFAYPIVDENKCIRCHRCIKVCPIKNNI